MATVLGVLLTGNVSVPAVLPRFHHNEGPDHWRLLESASFLYLN
jgi:hypothetical protein